MWQPEQWVAKSTAPAWLGSSFETEIPCFPKPQATRPKAAAAAMAVIQTGRTTRASYCLAPITMPAPDPARFRAAMGMLPTGVTVVTAGGADTPAGATANAVCSLSLDPMLMLACLDRGSRTLLAVQAANHFGVNVLGAGQEGVARAFSTKAPVADKWEGIEWSERDGLPAIAGSIAFVGCELRDVLAGGDHVIVTGEVREVDAEGGAPLVFHGGSYRPLK